MTVNPYLKYFEIPAALDDLGARTAENQRVDVVVPIMNTNPFWEQNLHNWYSRIPIGNLILGDGGTTDGSLEIAQKFPRVKILDQKEFKSLGFALRKLFEEVRSPWFIYLHADVTLPPGWFEAMVKNQSKYDWFESNQKNFICFEYLAIDHGRNEFPRAYSGAQMGRKEAFEKITAKVDDDYLYRNEDIIWGALIEGAGFKYGRTADTYISHQITNKNGEKEPKLASVAIARAVDPSWEKRTADMQARGIIKYLPPSSHNVYIVAVSLLELRKLKALDRKEFLNWVRATSPAWVSRVQRIYFVLTAEKIAMGFVRRAQTAIAVSRRLILFGRKT